MTKKRSIRWLAIVLALLMPIITVLVTVVSAETPATTGTKYESPDINALMGAGEEPEDISVSSAATYQEKAWYEYIMYSDNAVCSYRLTDTTRLLFYDPFTYTNALIMDFSLDADTPTYETMSSYTVSKTNSRTISTCGSSTYTSSEAVQESGRDITHTDVTNSGYTKTQYMHSTNAKVQGEIVNHKDYEYLTHLDVTAYLKANVGVTNSYVEDSLGYNEKLYVTEDTQTTSYNDYMTVTDYYGSDKVTNNTKSETDGWTELSARVTKTIGSSYSVSKTWSETESTTVTKTYAATHFASDGVTPLPWAIVHYRVQMPMKCCMQIFDGGEWVTISTAYCLLTTIQGTCRSWMQNGQPYYEDWGNGDPVAEVDFWGQFMSKERLIKAYEDKLYPTGGEN